MSYLHVFDNENCKKLVKFLFITLFTYKHAENGNKDNISQKYKFKYYIHVSFKIK